MLKDIFFDQVRPAYGCTEPIAVALAVATGKKYLKGELKEAYITLDKNTYKNGLVVTIPGTHFSGLEIAGALAYICGNPELGLEVLKHVDKNCTLEAKKHVKKFNVSIAKESPTLSIDVTLKGENTVRVTVKGKHDNIVHIEVEGKQILDKPFKNNGTLLEKIKQYTLDDIIGYIENPEEDVIKHVEKAIEMNLNIAKFGLENHNSFSKIAPNNNIKFVEAGIEARMDGALMPVMTVAGSGNQGLSCILPVASEIENFPRIKIIKAVLLSILTTIYIKAHTGLLTPICGAGVISAAGAAAGLTYLNNGTKEQIKNAINDTLGTLFGLTCDGAKRGCALKAGTGTFVALQSARLALAGINVPCGNGIVAKNVEETIDRVEKLTLSVKQFDNDVLDYIGKC
ncbi:serine dehydratase subunit alpha family protein [Thermosipho ferrireducens]|uniref:UPF0597 protein JYK00_08305 n=1 Tax=Thermosipho ferrireducens TaxID=2571116 RepID=A0ABX7S7E5_9BACT|nr:L-serine ammonia-lyase, iron-sulfur-dependent, subunit alpha [Thermosipho ferrireducens]QTA37715.1 serine dehydratase subunit alpha family protein [Thermosipho ferrireducens]